ncbi:hypothetical protein KSP39_PZI014314 [Platanthera zijinensis]|uniref:Reverse transcriptase n=1 Tax=Platanthera zijinensis TaxID=2320716 RepID=A0AAP0B9G8_9ASPA
MDSTVEEELPSPREKISDLESQLLVIPPTDAEIKKTVFSFGRNKAPGCDGVTHSFFTHFWNFTEFDLNAAVKNFFATGFMEAKWKETLVVLIPKCSSPSLPEHYRPISLCSTIYKVVAKIIANRMKPALQKLSNAISYLGIMLRPGKVRIADFDHLLDKITCKIRAWGLRHLSMAGRSALIRSTLSAIPLHALAHSPVPTSVINKINSLLSTFFWSGAIDKHSLHYTKWTELCLPKDKGGLGFKNLFQWRRILMGKMAARVGYTDGTVGKESVQSRPGHLLQFEQAQYHKNNAEK